MAIREGEAPEVELRGQGGRGGQVRGGVERMTDSGKELIALMWLWSPVLGGMRDVLLLDRLQ
jgi:hypothetical protein